MQNDLPACSFLPLRFLLSGGKSARQIAIALASRLPFRFPEELAARTLTAVFPFVGITEELAARTLTAIFLSGEVKRRRNTLRISSLCNEIRRKKRRQIKVASRFHLSDFTHQDFKNRFHRSAISPSFSRAIALPWLL